MVDIKKKPALLIVDVQNGFCHAQGTLGKLGMLAYDPMHIVSAIQNLRVACNADQIPVFFMRFCFREGYPDSGIIFDQWPHIKAAKGFVNDTWDAEIVNELQPDPSNPNEVVIEKTRFSSFWGTNLKEQLLKLGVDQILLTGFATNICVEATARDSFVEGFHCVTIENASAAPTKEFHDASIRNCAWFGQVAEADAVLEALRQKHQC